MTLIETIRAEVESACSDYDADEWDDERVLREYVNYSWQQFVDPEYVGFDWDGDNGPTLEQVEEFANDAQRLHAAQKYLETHFGAKKYLEYAKQFEE